MLKGNVKVTLFDKNGNVINSQEKSNLVTTASSTALNMCAGANYQQGRNLLYTHMPVAETILGGLLLFEDSISNPTVNTVLMPNDNDLVACANRTVDLTSDRRGSYNSDESGKVTGGYKSVWDFSTFQANNSISALALTSTECGANPFSCNCDTLLKQFSILTNGKKGDELVSYDLTNRGVPLKYDESTQEFYFLYRSNDSAPFTYKICKTRMPFYSFNVEDSVYDGGVVIETGNTVSIVSDDIQSYYSAIDPIGGYAYLGYNLSGYTLSYVKLNLSTFATEQKTRGMKRDSSIQMVVCNDIWYEIDTDKVYATQEGGTAVNTYDITGITLSYLGLLAKANGTVEVVRTDSRGTGGWVLYPDGTYDKIANGTTITLPAFAFETKSLLICKQTYFNFYMKKDYLGTVFNLQTPVPKTSATTMKVEYTLTNVTP